METDNQIRDFINTSYPEVSDSGKFLVELQEKLTILDQAKTVYCREQYDCKRWIVAAFLVGTLFGVATILSFFFNPKLSFEQTTRIIDLVISIICHSRFFLIASIISLFGLAICLYKCSSNRA